MIDRRLGRLVQERWQATGQIGNGLPDRYIPVVSFAEDLWAVPVEALWA